MALRALIKGMRDDKGKLLPMWSRTFVLSCVIAVLLDPLFFYILVIDQDNKCLQMDKKLSTIVLVLRSLMDIIFAVPFIYEVGKKIALNMSWLSFSIINDFLALLPIPQLLIVVTFYHMRGAIYVEHRMVLNVFIVGQYLPRIYRIHQSSKELRRNDGIWVKGPLYFVLYMVASHVVITKLEIVSVLLKVGFRPISLIILYGIRARERAVSCGNYQVGDNIDVVGNGYSARLSDNSTICTLKLPFVINYYQILGALWYFFSIQQETLCWHSACAKYSPDPFGCMNTFYCGHRTTTSKNIAFLNKHCPLDIPDGVLPPFDFGIFSDSLKNHNPEHIKFTKKFFYSFWWGLRNLSNFGTNLTTSTYVLENLFAILICVLGMLLFLYLIGNVQTFIQLEATKKEETRQRMRGGEVFRKKENVRNWIYDNNFPDDIENDILKSVDKALEKGKDADVENPFLILSLYTKEAVKRHLFMDKLKTVKDLKDLDDNALKSICHCLKPVTYIENSFVFRMGDPLNCMLLIMEGTMWTYASSDSNAGEGMSSAAIKFKPLTRGDFYGEELLEWASDRFTEVPVSSKHVKSQTKVKAFVLMVEDMETLVLSKVLKDARRKSDGGLGPSLE